jgi:hypothetical protein
LIRFILGALILFALQPAVDISAKSVYTWTDSDGALHITDRPPPKNANLRDTIKHLAAPANPLPEDEGPRELLEEPPADAGEQQEYQALKAMANEARKEALEARSRAEEAALNQKEYLNKVGRNKKMRRRNRYNLDKGAEYVKSTEEQARRAEQIASEAESKAEAAGHPAEELSY